MIQMPTTESNDCSATLNCVPIQSTQRQKHTTTTSPEVNAPSQTLPDACPAAIRNAVGIYEHVTPNSHQFRNAVLLTASNMDFYETLQNWELFAKSHGLRYAVLAMDDLLYEQLGPERAVPSSARFAIAKINGNNEAVGKHQYFTLVCNKMRLILEILETCQVDVIFSDADNVLLQDPFVHDLGKLITSGQWDYLYTTNDAWTATPRSHDCIASADGFANREGNTGFEYIASTATWVHEMMHRTVAKCERKTNRHHDQTLFWNMMQKRRTKDWVHCNAETYRELDNNYGKAAVLDASRDRNATLIPTMCCLDPHYYTVGAARPEKVDSLVAFHANYVKTQQEKIERLREWVNGWRVPNASSISKDAR